MKKIIILLIVFLIIIIFFCNIYRASNLSKKFDKFTNIDFESIGILEYDGIEHTYKNGSKEFILIKKTLFELLEAIRPTNDVLKRGEIKDVGDIILYVNNKVFYKLYFGYVSSRNTIRITINDSGNFSIVKHYYLENKDAKSFFSLLETMGTKRVTDTEFEKKGENNEVK